MKQTICPNCGGSLRSESIGWRCKKCNGFISLQDGKFYEYVEKPFAPPMTNADRIRAMSDEELAVLLADEIPHGDCCGCKLDCSTSEGDMFQPRVYKGNHECDCYNAFYKWLKQPAEDYISTSPMGIAHKN